MAPPRLLYEPLVHFALIGLALFAADRVLGHHDAPAVTKAFREAPSPRIAVTDEVRRMLSEEHLRVHGRAPTAAETSALVAGWINEEVLFREGLVRGLDEDDPRVRQRVVEKMTFVLEKGNAAPAPSESELAAWFDSHPGKWAKPPLVDFTHVFVQGDDPKARERARDLLAQLEKGTDPAGMGDTFSGGRRYRRRALTDLGESFGPDFAVGLGEQKEGTWALRQSRFGVHLVRVDKRTPAERPALSEVREDVAHDFLEAKRIETRDRAIAELRKRWTVDP